MENAVRTDDLCGILTACGAAKSGAVRLSECRILRQYQIDRLGFTPLCAVIGIIPYYTPLCDLPGSISAYARARDYHVLLADIGQKVLSECRRRFPENSFRICGDTSPIDEIDAAAKAGLGIIGRNRLLITEEYSSFVFLFELLTDLCPDDIPDARVPQTCENCGACAAACPGILGGRGDCLSAITQKKGVLTSEEEEKMIRFGTVWGCDVCQTVCPHTVSARERGTLTCGNEWFSRDVIPFPTEESVADEEDFSQRAYNWRGKDVILRNIRLFAERGIAPYEKHTP